MSVCPLVAMVAMGLEAIIIIIIIFCRETKCMGSFGTEIAIRPLGSR